MNRAANLIIKIVVGIVVIGYLVNTLSPGGPLGNLTGMLIAKYPFHGPVLESLGSSMGWDISFIPVVESSILDDILILLIATVISGGIAGVLKNILNPVDMRERGAEEYVQSTGYKIKGFAVSILSSVVTILFSNMIFASVIHKANASVIGGMVFTIVKVVILAAVVVLFAALLLQRCFHGR